MFVLASCGCLPCPLQPQGNFPSLVRSPAPGVLFGPVEQPGLQSVILGPWVLEQDWEDVESSWGSPGCGALSWPLCPVGPCVLAA